MGIRIHKVLGYGLTDVKVKDYQIADDRFDPLGFALSDWEDRKFWNRENFMIYCQHHLEKGEQYLLKYFFDPRQYAYADTKWEPEDSIFHDAEYGMENVFLIRAPTHKDWMRYDDTIDYHEECLHRGSEPWVKEILGGIWPWSTFYIDRRTGKRLGEKAFHLWRRYYYLEEIVNELNHHDWEYQALTRLTMNRWARELGFEDFFDAKKNIGPMIPPEIEILCRYLNLFNDEETIWQLRPLLYVYWG